MYVHTAAPQIQEKDDSQPDQLQPPKSNTFCFESEMALAAGSISSGTVLGK